jgi:hypothetical protein
MSDDTSVQRPASTVSETCCCGASCSVTAPRLAGARRTVEAWRTGHPCPKATPARPGFRP